MGTRSRRQLRHRSTCLFYRPLLPAAPRQRRKFISCADGNDGRLATTRRCSRGTGRRRLSTGSKLVHGVARHSYELGICAHDCRPRRHQDCAEPMRLTVMKLTSGIRAAALAMLTIVESARLGASRGRQHHAAELALAVDVGAGHRNLSRRHRGTVWHWRVSHLRSQSTHSGDPSMAHHFVFHRMDRTRSRVTVPTTQTGLGPVLRSHDAA